MNNNLLHKVKEFCKRIFNKRKNSYVVGNPWAGLSSYEDPLNSTEPLKFCGRDEESQELFSLIDDDIVITLYGKSGIGKTSLLNAGVFPLLRKNNYAPLYIRFGIDSFDEETFASHITNILTKQIHKTYGINAIKIVDIVPENINPESEDYLWCYFARRRFVNQNGEPIFPVIVLDQFEESIKNQRQQASLLLKQIVYMSNRQNKLKDTYINDEYYSYNYNFRFVISLREDDLYRLEDIININYLSSLRNGRYRLQNLSEEKAKSIVQSIGGEYIEINDIDKITELIINASTGKEDGFIQTNVISLICSRLFDLMTKNSQSKININAVVDYLSSDPFEEYYTTAIKSLSEGEKRFIETNFVSSDGRRNILPESYLINSVKSNKKLIDGGMPIFHRIQSVTGEHLIELIHDGICQTLIKHRTIRLEKKNRTILSLCLLILGLLGIWMLNKSIVNDFVTFFLTITSKDGINNLTYIEVVALTELLSIILLPIAVGAIVYDDRRKKTIAFTALIILLFPSFLYPHSTLEKLMYVFSKIENIYESHVGIENVLKGFANSTYVLIVYAICMLIIFTIGVFGKPGIRRNHKFWIYLWDSISVKLYLLIITGFLFYKSLFNNGYFIIDSYDSSWGLIILPLLTLNLFGINLKHKKNKWSFITYSLLLTILMSCSILEIFPTTIILIGFIIIAFILLIIFFYSNNFIEACYKSICNVLILAIVIISQIGYNPFRLENHNIYKVYPWKIVVAENLNQFGIYNAIYGDTLLIPQFQKNSSYRFNFYTNIPQNDYFDKVTKDSIGCPSAPFPFALYKKETGKWELALMYSPNYEYAISKIAHQEDGDSSTLSNKEAANLFIKLRNDIVKFCINGNDSILYSDVTHINKYEEIVKKNLQNSLHKLYDNGSLMTEEIIIPFIKALSQSLYMNMLKESILKDHYNDFIEWFACYYIVTSLTNVTSEVGIRWNNNYHYNWNLSLISDGNKSSSSNGSNSFHITLEGLNNDRIYAWNNLCYALFLLECNAYSCTYSSNIDKKFEDEKSSLYEILKSLDNIFLKLKNYKNVTENIIVNQNEYLANLADSIKNKQQLNSDDINKGIEIIKKSSSIANKIKKELPVEMKPLMQEIDSINNLSIGIALHRADSQFKDIIINTLNSMIKIIKKNPVNAYNGVLISLCQDLYVIGVMRGYNMEEFSKHMNIIDKFNTNTMYNFVKDIDNALKDYEQKRDSLKREFNSNILNVYQALDKFND